MSALPSSLILRPLGPPLRLLIGHVWDPFRLGLLVSVLGLPPVLCSILRCSPLLRLVLRLMPPLHLPCSSLAMESRLCRQLMQGLLLSLYMRHRAWSPLLRFLLGLPHARLVCSHLLLPGRPPLAWPRPFPRPCALVFSNLWRASPNCVSPLHCGWRSRMLLSLRLFLRGRCNGMRHPRCSAIWRSGDNGVNSLRALHPILLRLLLASCPTGCCRTPADKVWLQVLGKLCPGCRVLPVCPLCTKHLIPRWPKRSCMLPARSRGVRHCPFLSASSAGLSAGSCQPTSLCLTDMRRAACSVPSGVPCVGPMHCGSHPPRSMSNWSRAVLSASPPGPKRPKLACTGEHCYSASLGPRLPAGASHSGPCCLRSCISRGAWIQSVPYA